MIAPMLKTVGRFLVLRVLPRRLLPILTVVEVVQLLRAARRQRASSANHGRSAGGSYPEAREGRR